MKVDASFFFHSVLSYKSTLFHFFYLAATEVLAACCCCCWQFRGRLKSIMWGSGLWIAQCIHPRDCCTPRALHSISDKSLPFLGKALAISAGSTTCLEVERRRKARNVRLSHLFLETKVFGLSCILLTYIRTYRRSTFQSIEFVKLALCLDRQKRRRTLVFDILKRKLETVLGHG